MVRRFEWPEGVDYDTLLDAVSVTTNVLSRRYSRYGIDRDDISQELWIWCMHNTKWLVDWLVREEQAEQRQGYAALTKSLRRAGERFCRREKAAITGYRTEDEFFYEENMIKDWLSVRANGVGVLDSTEFVGKVKNRKVASEGWNVEAIIADLDRALGKLDAKARGIVVALYGDGEKAERVAMDFGVTRQAIEQQAQRALRKMVEELGGRNPW